MSTSQAAAALSMILSLAFSGQERSNSAELGSDRSSAPVTGAPHSQPLVPDLWAGKASSYSARRRPSHGDPPPTDADRSLGSSASRSPAHDLLRDLVARQRDELAGLRRAMRTRSVIEQAKGVLVARLRVTPQQAFEQLTRLSQETNTRLAALSAAIVGTAAPDPDLPDLTELISRRVSDRVGGLPVARLLVDPGTPARRPAALEALQTHHALLSARIAAARTANEIAEALAAEAAGWPAPDSVLLTSLQPDGALRLHGSYGLAEHERLQWLRLPPQLDVPLTRAVRRRAPIVLNDHEAVCRQFPSLAERYPPIGAVVASPLVDHGAIVGSLSLRWGSPLHLSADARRYLLALLEPVASRLRDLADTATEVQEADAAVANVAADLWLPIPLEAMHNPAVVLAPISDADAVVDLRVVRANTHARRELEQAALREDDVTLLSMFPQAGATVLLEACLQALRGGGLRQLDDVRVGATDLGGGRVHGLSARITRISDRVLMVWQPVRPAELAYQQLLHGERISKVGTVRWDPTTGATLWSIQLSEMLGVDQRDQLDLSQLERHIHPQDLAAARRLVREVLERGNPATADLRGTGRLADRYVRVTAEPLTDKAGSAIVATVQDLTVHRHTEEQLRRSEQELRDRRQTAQRTRTLVRAVSDVMSMPSGNFRQRGLTVTRGRLEGAEDKGIAWHDAQILPGGDVHLAVGLIVGGSDDLTAAAAERLKHALRAFATIGGRPGQVLDQANTLARLESPGSQATAVVVRYEPAGRALAWASAGPNAPVVFDGRRGQPLVGPLGLPVGVAVQGAYHETRTSLPIGRELLLFSAAAGDNLTRAMARLTDVPTDVDLTDPVAMIELLNEPATSRIPRVALTATVMPDGPTVDA